MAIPAAYDGWRQCIDVSEHQCVDFGNAAGQGADGVIVRAGRGTRQDAKWIENVRAVQTNGLDVGSYWHLYPSHTDAHHQAELWMAAIRGAKRWSFALDHWADIGAADGFDPYELGRYVAAFLRRMDALLGCTVGVFTSEAFWSSNVRFDDERPRWMCGLRALVEPPATNEVCGVRTRPSDRGGPGWHLVRRSARLSNPDDERDDLHLITRGSDESVGEWKSRWIRRREVVVLQEQLNQLGATLLVDGVYGPATDAAARTRDLLRRRDRIESCADPDVNEGSGNPARPVLL